MPSRAIYAARCPGWPARAARWSTCRRISPTGGRYPPSRHRRIPRAGGVVDAITASRASCRRVAYGALVAIRAVMKMSKARATWPMYHRNHRDTGQSPMLRRRDVEVPSATRRASKAPAERLVDGVGIAMRGQFAPGDGLRSSCKKRITRAGTRS